MHRHQSSAEDDLRNQIKSLLIDKGHMEHNMRKLLEQMQTAQRETHSYMQKTHDLMERLTQAQTENRDLLRQLMNVNRQHIIHARAPETLYNTNSVPQMQTQHSDLLDLNPSLPHHQVQLHQPAIQYGHHTDPPSTVTFPNQPSVVVSQDFPSDQQVKPDHYSYNNNPQMSFQDKLIQQLVDNSNAQKTFYQSKLDESSHDVKFPKFSGKTDEKFSNWYNQVLSVLATPKWCTLYDPVSEDIINESEAPINLSTSLYSKLMLSLTGEAQNILMSKPHLRGKGLDSLKALQATYDLVMSDPQSLIKSAEFARPMRKPSESVTAYAARLIQLRRDLQGFETVSDDRFRLRFIMGLGPMFTTIQSNLKNLPNWNTTNIELLIKEANEHIQTTEAIREQNKFHRSLKEGGSSNNNKPDRDKMVQEKNQKRMKEIDAELAQGTFSPAKYVKMVRKDYCVYHNANHTTTQCAHIRAMLSKYPNNTFVCSPAPPPRPAPNALQVTPPSFNVVPPPTSVPHQPTITANQVNMDSIQEIDLRELQLQDAERQLAELDKQLKSNHQVNPYRIYSNHVVSNNGNIPTNSSNENLKFVIDSGAFPHMCNAKHHFSTFSSKLPCHMTHVTLADGVSKSKIEGIGSIAMAFGKNKHVIHNVLYVPQLSTSLYSIKHHCMQQGCIFYVEGNSATLTFPTFVHNVKIKDELILHATSFKAIFKSHDPNPSVQDCPKTNKVTLTKTVNTNSILKYYLSSVNAKAPTKSTSESAGYDLYASRRVIIPPNSRCKVNTHLSLEIPHGTYGRIAARSGLTMSHNIDVGAGVIDSDYRGEVIPILINNSKTPFLIQIGDKIAQIIMTKLTLTTLQETNNLSNTLRGEQGFGSSDTELVLAPHKINLMLNQLKFNKKITLKIPDQQDFTKGSMRFENDEYIFHLKEFPKVIHTFNVDQIKFLIQRRHLLLGHSHLITTHETNTNDHRLPLLRTVDTPLGSSPSKISYSIDQLRRNFGFRNVDSIAKELRITSKDTFSISTLDREPIIDLGEVSTMDRPPRNTHPLPLPQNVGEVVHADIIFGSGVAIGGARYALFLVDRATRHKFVYPIQDLKTDILPSFIKFFAEIGRVPSLIRTDFDYKLMGRTIEKHLELNQCQLQSAPPELQSINGVCERNWRSILRMARSWLASALLPSNFWWFALKRATEVSNYIPLKRNAKLTTPHELVYGTKPDLRNLLPMFAIAYTSYSSPHSYDTQSVKTILVGRSNKSNAALFYHPATRQLLTSTRFKIDEVHTAGPAFGLQYEGGMYFNKYIDKASPNDIPAFNPESSVYLKHNGTIIQAEIISVPISNDLYTVQYNDGSIHQHKETELSSSNPSVDPSTQNSTLQTFPEWVQKKGKCTLFLHSMSRPKHGTTS